MEPFSCQLFFLLYVRSILISFCPLKGQIQLTLEQLEFELHRSTYIWGFFSIVNTTVLLDSRLVESMVMEESRIWRADYRLYSDFWLFEGSAPLTPAFFKDQVYCPFRKLSFFKPLFPIVIILFLSPFSKAFWKSSILLLSPHVPLCLKTPTSWIPFLWNTSLFIEQLFSTWELQRIVLNFCLFYFFWHSWLFLETDFQDMALYWFYSCFFIFLGPLCKLLIFPFLL